MVVFCKKVSVIKTDFPPPHPIVFTYIKWWIRIFSFQLKMITSEVEERRLLTRAA